MTANPHNIALEAAAQEFVEANANPPFLFQLSPEAGRAAVDEVQDEPIYKPEIDEKWIGIDFEATGSVATRIARPKGLRGQLRW